MAPSVPHFNAYKAFAVSDASFMPLEVQLELGLDKGVLCYCFLLFQDEKKNLNIGCFCLAQRIPIVSRQTAPSGEQSCTSGLQAPESLLSQVSFDAHLSVLWARRRPLHSLAELCVLGEALSLLGLESPRCSAFQCLWLGSLLCCTPTCLSFLPQLVAAHG